jgi:hypothetical protein
MTTAIESTQQASTWQLFVCKAMKLLPSKDSLLHVIDFQLQKSEMNFRLFVDAFCVLSRDRVRNSGAQNTLIFREGLK